MSFRRSSVSRRLCRPRTPNRAAVRPRLYSYLTHCCHRYPRKASSCQSDTTARENVVSNHDTCHQIQTRRVNIERCDQWVREIHSAQRQPPICPRLPKPVKCIGEHRHKEHKKEKQPYDAGEQHYVDVRIVEQQRANPLQVRELLALDIPLAEQQDVTCGC